MRLFLLASAMAAVFALSAARGNPAGDQCQGLGKRIVALINEYKELRKRRRLLPEGTHDTDLRDHGGKLHRVLQSLGTELGHSPFTKKVIVGCLGEPDAVRNEIQMAPYLGIYERERRKAGREPRAKRDREYLVYYGRGGHDFMFFINKGGLIVDHGWWFSNCFLKPLLKHARLQSHPRRCRGFRWLELFCLSSSG